MKLESIGALAGFSAFRLEDYDIINSRKFQRSSKTAPLIRFFGVLIVKISCAMYTLGLNEINQLNSHSMG